jgi:hypothetical protein
MIDKLRRQGLHMSSEALAAPADGPSEDDYKAFYSVLASSARGRAFLAEHARRARDAETETLLAAITRIEATLAEQRAPEPTAAAPPPATTALAAVAAQAIAAAESDLPVMKVIKAGQMPPPARFAGDDFAAEEPAGAEPAPDAASEPVVEATDLAVSSNVIAAEVPAEHAAPPGTAVAEALAAILALSEDERLALFS